MPRPHGILETQSDRTTKCQQYFVANKPYLDHSICLLICVNTKHLNAQGKHYHGSIVSGFQYALGSGIPEELTLKIAQMHLFCLPPTQIM